MGKDKPTVLLSYCTLKAEHADQQGQWKSLELRNSLWNFYENFKIGDSERGTVSWNIDDGPYRLLYQFLKQEVLVGGDSQLYQRLQLRENLNRHYFSYVSHLYFYHLYKNRRCILRCKALRNL